MIYEDGAVRAELLRNAATLGHIRIKPVKNADSLTDLEYEEALQLFWTASFSATAVFETLGAQGSNIILQDGDGVCMDVFARNPDDSLNLQWEPQPGDRSEIESVASKIKDAFWYVGKQESSQSAPKPKQAPARSQEPVDDSDDPRIKHLRRSW